MVGNHENAKLLQNRPPTKKERRNPLLPNITECVCCPLTLIFKSFITVAHSGTGDLVKLLNVTSDEKILPTTYGELRPPLGKHRLKVCIVYIL